MQSSKSLTVVAEHLFRHRVRRIVEERDVPLLVRALRVVHKYRVLSTRYVHAAPLVRRARVRLPAGQDLGLVEACAKTGLVNRGIAVRL